MKVVVHDRTDALPARLRVYAEMRLNRLSRHFDRILEAEVDFSLEQKRNQSAGRCVQIVVRTDGHKHALLRARESAPEARAALDLALDKIDRQVHRLKEKVKMERKRAPSHAELATEEGGGAQEPERHPAPDRIRMHLEPESVEAAERALDANGHSFYVFLDEDSGAVSVAYRKRDGSLAVIEPILGK